MAPGQSRISAVRRRLVGPLVVGCLTFAVGATWLIRTAVFVIGATNAPAAIFAVERRDLVTWNLTYGFRDSAGTLHTERTWTFSSEYEGLGTGGGLSVLYDAASPERSKIDSFWALWFAPLIITVLGLFLSGAAYRLSRLTVA